MKIRNKPIYLSLVILFFLLNCNNDSTTSNCPSVKSWDIGTYPQQISLSGNEFVNESGAKVVLRGVSHFDPLWQAKGEDPDVGRWEVQQFDQMKSWNVNLVRLPVHPAVWRRYGDSELFAVLDQALNWLAQREIYAIIDFHSIGFPPENDYMSGADIIFGELYQTTDSEINDFWQKISSRYVNNKTVAFYEIFNEPARDSALGFPNETSPSDWNLWKTYTENIITIIRNNDPDTIILVGGFQFAYDLTYLSSNPIAGTGVAYSVHIYPDSNWKINWDTAIGNFRESYAMVATEFGFDNSDNAYKESLYNDWGGEGIFSIELITFFERLDIGWTAWSFGVFPPGLLADENYKPTEYGSFIKCVLANQ